MEDSIDLTNENDDKKSDLSRLQKLMSIGNYNYRKLTLEERNAVIDEYKKVPSVRHLAQLFNCGRTQIQNIIRNIHSQDPSFSITRNPGGRPKKSINKKEMSDSKRRLNDKHLKGSNIGARFILLNIIVREWLKRCRLHKIRLRRQNVREYAFHVARSMKFNEFNGSTHWLTQFLTQNKGEFFYTMSDNIDILFDEPADKSMDADDILHEAMTDVSLKRIMNNEPINELDLHVLELYEQGKREICNRGPPQSVSKVENEKTEKPKMYSILPLSKEMKKTSNMGNTYFSSSGSSSIAAVTTNNSKNIRVYPPAPNKKPRLENTDSAHSSPVIVDNEDEDPLKLDYIPSIDEDDQINENFCDDVADGDFVEIDYIMNTDTRDGASCSGIGDENDEDYEFNEDDEISSIENFEIDEDDINKEVNDLIFVDKNKKSNKKSINKSEDNSDASSSARTEFEELSSFQIISPPSEQNREEVHSQNEGTLEGIIKEENEISIINYQESLVSSSCSKSVVNNGVRITSYAAALNHLKPLEEFAFMDGNSRVIGLINQLENLLTDLISQKRNNATNLDGS